MQVIAANIQCASERSNMSRGHALPVSRTTQEVGSIAVDLISHEGLICPHVAVLRAGVLASWYASGASSRT